MGTRRDEFESLFESEFDRCALAARRIVASTSMGEELAAEAFTRAWVRWRQVRRLSSPGGWAMRVTVNLALDQVRRGVAPAPAAFDAKAMDDVVIAHLSLIGAVNQLPSKQRIAISLRYLADLPVDDVAHAMGVSSGTVKTHLHRGLERLRSLLTVDESDLEARLAQA